MISHDYSMVDSRPTASDTRDRHLLYAEALRRRHSDGDITVVLRAPPSASASPFVLSEGVRVLPVPCRRWAFPLAARRLLRKVLEGETFDLTATQTPFDDGLVGTWLKRKYGVPLHVQMNTSFLDMPQWINERPLLYRALNALGKWVAARADSIRAVSEGERRRLEELFPTWNGKVIALHPMVNHRLFDGAIGDQESKTLETEMRVAALEGRPFVLFVGRLAKQKNIPLLLRSFALMRQERPNLALVLAGVGPLMEGSRRLAVRLGIDRDLLWLGARPLAELKVWYSGASATLLPSFHEGFGRVIVESYLAGTPCVVTPFVSARELVKHGETGAVSGSFDDAQEFAEHSLRVVQESKEMGAIGEAHIRRYILDDDAYTNRLVDIWEATAGRSVMA